MFGKMEIQQFYLQGDFFVLDVSKRVDHPFWDDDRENVLKAANEIVMQRLQVLAIHFYVSVRSLTFLFHFDEVLKLAQLTYCKPPLEQKQPRHERRNNGLCLN
ncbi:hypothetical protein M513_08431 [Trichuris suis]|uniref:Uncharacterized protein n=1 Tax=Trichuris suis TaxID=68888 RepID=A0A085M078_9BILA|nr:hypothetical protein M513_08431 [Trichuris suis]